jgi:FkbM family methyltransferase
MSAVRTLIKSPLLGLLAWPAFRRRAIFELRQRYYGELANGISLGHGLQCPLLLPDAWSSFAEVFVHGEYAAAFDRLPLPSRWVDLGCHAGYFSLYVAWKRALAGESGPGTALLVDADSRLPPAVATLLEQNGLTDCFQFVHALVASGDGARDFRERGHMASSLAMPGVEDGRLTRVPILTAADLICRFPPPYDLLKVDIEGGEYEFLRSYGDVLDAARALLIEWHASDDAAAHARASVCEELERRGFTAMRELGPPRTTRGPRVSTAGLLLFLRTP